jgi:predicted HicB family RNase H-like nuclease
MSEKPDRYAYRVTWSEEDQEYVGLCVEFGSLSWLAKSPQSALRGIRKIVDDVIKDMERSGETPPLPLAGKHFSGKLLVRVPPDVHRILTIKAAEQGISLNRLISSKLSQV